MEKLSLQSVPSLLKNQHEHLVPRRHLMLAGISQDVFLKQWGSPEIEINLDQLQGSYRHHAVALETGNAGENLHSVWIYKEKNRVFFFSRKRLVSHYKWSDFKEGLATSSGQPDFKSASRSTFIASTLSLVA